MPITWTIAIDWNRDGSFAGTNEDVTSRVIDAKWFLGTQKPYQEQADNSLLTLVLDNSDKRFSPDNASSPIYPNLLPFRPVRIQSYDGVTTRTHWIGWIENIKPVVSQYGKRTVEILAQGPMQFFMAVESKLPLQQNQPTDAIIKALVEEVVIPPSALNVWFIGMMGFSEAGQNTVINDGNVYFSADAGKINLDLAGDNWVRQGGASDVKQDTFDVYRCIKDVAAAERGRFLFDRSGKAVFWNRHHLLDPGTPAVTLNNSMSDMEYTYASSDQLKNEIIIECHPRTISADSSQILWQLPNNTTIRVDANGAKKETFVRYEDENGKRVGAQNVTFSDMTFTDDKVIGNVSITLDPKANGVNLTFINNGSIPAYVKSLIIRGQKITDSDQMQARSTDDVSIAKYGRRQLKLNLPSVASLEQAQYIADFERNRRGTPIGQVASVKLISQAASGVGTNVQQVQRTLGDLVEIQEAQTGHDSNYYIIGEMHRLYQDGNILETTWYLEPAPVAPLAWKLGATGRAEVGQNTYLTY